MKSKNLIQNLFVATLVAGLIFQQSVVANAVCKKWTYDFSEKVTYSDTALEACKKYVKEKYTNDNYAASVEPTNDPEVQRCSAGDTYFGLVYLKECATCCKKPSQSQPVLGQSASCSVSRPENNLSDKDGMFGGTAKQAIEKKLEKNKV